MGFSLGSLLPGFGGGGQEGIGNKQNTSSTSNATTTTYTDSSANAGGDDSIALGSGANLNITTSDPTTVAAALDTVKANNALTAAQYAASLNTLAGTQQVAANANKATQDAANLAIQSTQSLASQLSGAGALKTPQSETAVTTTLAKYGAIAVAVIVLGTVAALLLFRKRKD